MRGLGVGVVEQSDSSFTTGLVPPLATHSAVHKMCENNNIVRYCSFNGVQHLLERLQCTTQPLFVASNGRHGGELLHGAPRMCRN